MDPIDHSLCNMTFQPPTKPIPGVEVVPLPAFAGVDCEGVPSIMSFWMPDQKERALIAAGHPVAVNLITSHMVPMAVGVALRKE